MVDASGVMVSWQTVMSYTASHSNLIKVLKIDTNVGDNNGNVTTIDAKLPEKGNRKWVSGAKSKIDGCIYCMPESANRILKIDPTDDSFESVGEDLGNGYYKFWGTVADEDGFIYGIPEIFYDQLTLSPPDSVTNFHEAYAEACKILKLRGWAFIDPDARKELSDMINQERKWNLQAAGVICIYNSSIT